MLPKQQSTNFWSQGILGVKIVQKKYTCILPHILACISFIIYSIHMMSYLLPHTSYPHIHPYTKTLWLGENALDFT
jgi:hypothetical protein